MYTRGFEIFLGQWNVSSVSFCKPQLSAISSYQQSKHRYQLSHGAILARGSAGHISSTRHTFALNRNSTTKLYDRNTHTFQLNDRCIQ